MILRARVTSGVYFDSVTLMQVSLRVKDSPGVEAAVVGMGTDFNLESARRLGLATPEIDGAKPNDLILAVRAASVGEAEAALALAEKLITEKKSARAEDRAESPPTLAAAMREMPDSNLVLISVPGAFAAREARTALEAGKHVFLFSDNVSVEEEVSLKELAVSKGLLMMGPDCGTAILNGTPIAFANAVRRGDVGVVAASGTGLQEVTSLIHRFGRGVSQAIGVGGRDLSEKVAGRMTILAALALAEDPATRVLLLVSKPPAAATETILFERLKNVSKPVVVYFIGADPAKIRAAGFHPAANLEEAARTAAALSAGGEIAPLATDDEIGAKARAAKRRKGAHALRGLYSGGTFCDEAQRLLAPVLGEISSNTPIPGARRVKDLHRSEGHTILDLGDDDFTRGRAHPMIDATARKERLAQELEDDETDILLLDVVLGYGSHADMAGELAGTIRAVRGKGKPLPVIAASICGTDEDPQDASAQRRRLEDAGVAVFPSHASMIRFAAEVLRA